MAEAGKYRRRVSLINNQVGKDVYGSWYTDPILHITCWAYRTKLSSQHGYVQYANSYGSSFKYEIYYNSGVVIDSNMILRDDGVDYKITSIIVTGDKKVKWELICTVKEV
jgi:hypothetical protein